MVCIHCNNFTMYSASIPYSNTAKGVLQLAVSQGGGRRGGLTLTVLRTEVIRGKSATPFSRVLTEDSSKDSDVRSAATHSPYVTMLGLVMTRVYIVPVEVGTMSREVGWAGVY
jgi:hypothetical protein